MMRISEITNDSAEPSNNPFLEEWRILPQFPIQMELIKSPFITHSELTEWTRRCRCQPFSVNFSFFQSVTVNTKLYCYLLAGQRGFNMVNDIFLELR